MTRLLGPAPTPGPADATEVAATVNGAVQRILDLPADQSATAERLTRDAAELTGSLRLLTGLDAAEQLASTPAAAPTMTEAEALRANAAAALKAAQDKAQELTAAAMRFDAEHRAAVDALDRRRRDHEAAAERIAQSAQDLARDIRGLPPLVSAPLVTALNLTAADPGAALLTAGELPADLLTDLQGQLSSKQAELEQLSDQRETVSAALRKLDGQRTQLRDARMEAVDRPRASARRSWERANGTLESLTSSLTPLQDNWERLSRTAQAPPLPPPTAELTAVTDLDVTDEQLSAEVASLGARLAVAVSHVSGVIAAARDAVRLADGKAQELLATAGATTLDDLAEQLSQAKHELRHSTALHQRATAQVPLAEGLDIGPSSAVREHTMA